MKTLCRLLTAGLVLAITATTAFAWARRPPEVYGDKHHGIVVEMPGNGIGIWNVTGERVVVTKETQIDETRGKAEVGALVEVTGKEQTNYFSAQKIEVKLPHKGRR